MGAVVAVKRAGKGAAYSTDQSIEEMHLSYRSERRFWNGRLVRMLKARKIEDGPDAPREYPGALRPPGLGRRK